ncbi:hypothetical protein TWF730_002638 [Orbilia blumenaviensis]|uniref:P-loop containing nucleoside triphosphate hydrolase protein n=1 Tax=Orbilia blumenaviensis TaxID=1796055 RepID=A0AAV9UEX3_9PEZI
MPLEGAEDNMLHCWLYDIFYRHVPAGRQPKVKDIVKQAKNTKRPRYLSGVPFPAIEERIRDDLVSSLSFRNPPIPGSTAVAQAFPHWTSWHHGRSSTSPAAPVATVTPVAPSAPAVPRASFAPNIAYPPQAPTTHLAAPPGPRQYAQRGRPAQTQNPDRPVGAFKTKAHIFRSTAYNARAIAIDSGGSSLPFMEAPPRIFEGGWRDRLIGYNAAAMFDWNPDNVGSTQSSNEAIISTAPLFTSDIIRVDSSVDDAPPGSVQFAIFAKLHSYRDPASTYQYQEELEDDMVFLNTNTPFTTFICGLQGSGKSHSLSVIMENCVIQNPAIGILHRPLAGVVFYFSPFTPLDAGKPCEVAYLAVPCAESTAPVGSYLSRARKVTVLVSRSNLSNMQRVYGKIPGVKVYPLLLKASQLTAKTMLHLMSVQEDNTSLYLQVVTRILRDMAAEGGFNYEKFKSQLSTEPLNASQWALLDLRLELLESFLGAEDNPNPFDASEGSITIVDLTCPFVDSETACVLFSICLDLFCSSPSTTGKIVALDEAHKFMSQTSSSQQFAKSVIQNIRLQRHLGLRTVISTQDPHVHPELLELSSFIIMHRFDSPRWFATLRKHVGFLNTTESGNSAEDREINEHAASAFETIMNLNAGQALVYCPRLMTVDYRGEQERVVRLGNRLISMQVRKRLTQDGGVTKTAL